MFDVLDGTAAERVPAWTRPTVRRFTASALAAGAHFTPWADPEPTVPGNADAMAEEAYNVGVTDGRAAAEAELIDEAAAIERLARAIETIEAAPSAHLAALLGESVRRLVAQIIGEVQIDETTLAHRTQEIATLIAEEAAPARIRLHPADLARLHGVATDVELVADPSLAPGSILAETASGWIEDSPAIRLERLRGALDRMGCPK
jgi:flagellar assembly protein FliH